MLCCAASKFGLTLCVGVVAGFVVHSSMSPSAAMQPEGEAPSMDAMMAEMARLGTPGEHHTKLSRTVGEWNVDATFMMPGAPEMKGTGTMTSQWVLNGRFVHTDFKMPEFMGMPFTGIGYNGYDNSTESYVGVWMDNMSTKAFVTEGELIADGSFVWIGDTAMGTKMKIVQTMPDKNTMHDEFYDQIDGEWVKSGVMHYTRK